MENFIIIAVVAIIVIAAGGYVYKSNKSGKTCIGCPHSQSCASKKGDTSCGCGCAK